MNEVDDTTIWLLKGNLLINATKPPNFEKNTRLLAEHVTELNLMNMWYEMSFLEKLWLVVSYPFRQKQ